MSTTINNPLSDDLDLILEHTEELWRELKGERIFITGGTGFFGCWLLESFLWAKHRLNLNLSAVVLTRNLPAFQQKAPHLTIDPVIQFCQGDIKNFPFPTGEFSHIIHAATEASAQLARENPQAMYNTIVDGMRRVLEFAASCGAKKLLFTSSGAVYGKQPPEISHITEEYLSKYGQEKDKASYGMGKIRAEELCRQAAAQKSALAVKIARCFACVGPYLPLDIHFAIGNFILNGLRGEDMEIQGDGTPYRSYVYAADLMIWLWHILMRGKNCDAYNVGAEKAITIADLAYTVSQHFDRSGLKINIAKQAPVDHIAERYVPSTQLAQTELGLRQMVGLDDAIEKTKQWHLSLGVQI